MTVFLIFLLASPILFSQTQKDDRELNSIIQQKTLEAGNSDPMAMLIKQKIKDDQDRVQAQKSHADGLTKLIQDKLSASATQQSTPNPKADEEITAIEYPDVATRRGLDAAQEQAEEQLLRESAKNSDLVSNKKTSQKVFLDVEMGSHASIYSDPSLNYLNCTEENGCFKEKALAWPGSGQEMTFTGQTKIEKVQINADGDMGYVEYAEVEFNFTSDTWSVPRKGKGWIASDRLRPQKVEQIFQKPLIEACDTCETLEKRRIRATKNVKIAADNSFHANVDDISAKLRGKIGKCGIPLKDPKGSRVPYDTQILPELEKEKWPNIEKERVNGKKTMATKDDFIAIDAVARTLYGEMAQCHRKGLQYPMAVARMISNRAKLIEKNKVKKKEFCGYTHAPGKNSIAQVATQPIQFSTWNRDQNIKHPLCPPSDLKKPFYNGKMPPAAEVAIWNDMVRIATEMVLFPQYFENTRTKDIGDAMHYVSYVQDKEVKIRNFTPFQKTFKVADRPIDNKRCLVLMQPNPKYRKDYKLSRSEIELLSRDREFAVF